MKLISVSAMIILGFAIFHHPPLLNLDLEAATETLFVDVTDLGEYDEEESTFTFDKFTFDDTELSIKANQSVATLNGKTVDLSGLDSEKLALALKEFEKGYIALQNSNDSNKLYELNEMLSGKRMSETQMLNMMTDILGISKDVSNEIVIDARKGLDARIQRERDNLSNQFKNVLGSDLCSEATTKCIKVMQKTKDNKWVLTNLFDPNDTLDQRHSKFYQSLDKGEQLYLTSNTKSNLTKINVTNKKIVISGLTRGF